MNSCISCISWGSPLWNLTFPESVRIDYLNISFDFDRTATDKPAKYAKESQLADSGRQRARTVSSRRSQKDH